MQRSTWFSKVSMTSMWAVFLVVLLAVSVLTPTPAMAKAKVTIKVQSAFPSKVPILGDTLVVLAEEVKTLSGGTMEIKIYEPMKLAPTLEIFDSIASGTLDGGWSYPGYWVGKNSAFNLFAALPFGPTADGYLAWFYRGGGLELWRELYGKHNIVPLLGGLNSPEAGGWFNKEINSVEDLKGLKVRWAGLGANILQHFGVSTSLIPVGEIVTSLQKGVIDGAELGNPFLDSVFGVNKGAKYYYFPGWHQTFGTMELMINKDVWDGLTDQQRAILQAAANTSTIQSLATGASLQADAMAKFKEEGVQFKRYPMEVLKAIKAQMPKTMAEEGEKNPDFKRVYESMHSFLVKYDLYNDLNNLKLD